MTNKVKYLLLITIIIFLFSRNKTNAQTFKGGLLFGVSGSQIDGDVQSGYSKAGIFAGGFVKKEINEKSAFYIEMYYIGKGALSKTEYADGTVYEDFKVVLHYVEMPFLYHLKVTKRVSFKGGLAPAYLFKAKIFNQGSKNPIPESQYDMKNIDVSLMGQADFSLNKKIGFNVKFSYSPVSIRKDLWWVNNNMSIGIRYNFQ